MSILNIGLQSVGIMRQKIESFEEALNSCSNFSSIRTLGTNNLNLEGEVLDALAPMKALLQGIGLQLKYHKSDTFEAASKLKMDELWGNILAVDETITPETTTNNETQKERFQHFLQQHCQVHHYMFSVNPPLVPVNFHDCQKMSLTPSTICQTPCQMVTTTESLNTCTET